MTPSSSGQWAGSVSACWNTLNKKLEGGLGTWNPAKSVEKDRLTAKRERIADADLPDWYARVQTMRNPIQRDGLLLALFTGLAGAVLAVPALDRRRSCWTRPRRCSASAAGGAGPTTSWCARQAAAATSNALATTSAAVAAMAFLTRPRSEPAWWPVVADGGRGRGALELHWRDQLGPGGRRAARGVAGHQLGGDRGGRGTVLARLGARRSVLAGDASLTANARGNGSYSVRGRRPSYASDLEQT
jgi:hypothetical protein